MLQKQEAKNQYGHVKYNSIRNKQQNASINEWILTQLKATGNWKYYSESWKFLIFLGVLVPIELTKEGVTFS